jgi:hypothetical protein
MGANVRYTITEVLHSLIRRCEVPNYEGEDVEGTHEYSIVSEI